MRRTAAAAGQSLLYVFAFAWPWEVYGDIPRLGFSLPDALAFMILCLWAMDMAAQRQLRVPFELTWPVVALVALVWAGFLRGELESPLRTTGALLLFPGTVHLVTSHRIIRRCLWLSMVAIVCVAVLSLASQTGFLFPTAFATHARIEFAFPRTLESGGLTLILGLLIASSFVRFPHTTSASRWVPTAYALIITAALALPTVACTGLINQWRAVDLRNISWVWGAFALLILWLVSRVAAKIEIDRREAPSFRHSLFLAMLLVWAVFALLFRPVPRNGDFFLLGLAAAYAVGSKDGVIVPVPRPALVAVVLLAGINLWHVWPSNVNDPRNYAAAALRDYQAGRIEKLWDRMDRIQQLAPAERTTYYWKARTALSERRTHLAAALFAEAMKRQARRTVLPGPRIPEVDDFVVQMRDLTSSLPPEERRLAYEEALIGARRLDSAMASLRLRINGETGETPRLTPWNLAQIVAFLFGDQGLAPRFADWRTEALLDLLHLWGAETGSAPEGFPANKLPLVLAARSGPGRIDILCKTGAADLRSSATRELPPPVGRLTAWTDAGWVVHEDGHGTGWTFTLGLTGMHGPEQVAQVRASAGRHFASLETYNLARGPVPETPAVFIWFEAP
jgi:hypothetical protein